MEARVVDVGRGWQWIAEAFGLFRKAPAIWIVLMVIYLIIVVAVAMIPLIGSIAMALFAPVFTAGFLIGARALEKGGELEIAHLFAGFRHNTSQLVTAGGIYLVGSILVLGAMFLIGGAAMFSHMTTTGTTPEMGSGSMTMGTAQFSLPMLFALLLLTPLMMASWFAPALIVFNNLPAWPAMKTSFFACLRNVIPFLVYGVIMLLLMLIAAIPFGLGLLVLLPMFVATMYTSYKDVFSPTEAQLDDTQIEDI